MQWFRWHHNTVTDPKFAAIARRIELSRAEVLAVWAVCLESASQSEPRGVVRIEADEIAALLDLDIASVEALLKAFLDRGMIADGNTLANWERRQPSSDSSAERVRKHRAKKSEATGSGYHPPRNRAATRTETAGNGYVTSDSESESVGGVQGGRPRNAPRRSDTPPDTADLVRGAARALADGAHPSAAQSMAGRGPPQSRGKDPNAEDTAAVLPQDGVRGQGAGLRVLPDTPAPRGRKRSRRAKAGGREAAEREQAGLWPCPVATPAADETGAESAVRGVLSPGADGGGAARRPQEAAGGRRRE